VAAVPVRHGPEGVCAVLCWYIDRDVIYKEREARVGIKTRYLLWCSGVQKRAYKDVYNE
jgi:hypothetical protein